MPFKTFQSEDLVRAALVDGAILAWDTGLGKSWVAFAWPCLKLGWSLDPRPSSLVPAGRVLIVAPGDLHQQLTDEGRTHFKAPVTRLDSQATYEALLRPSTLDPRPSLPNGFYITSYTQLGVNGTRKEPETYPEYLAFCADLGLKPQPPHVQFLLDDGRDNKRPLIVAARPEAGKPDPITLRPGDKWMSYRILAVYHHLPEGAMAGIGQERHGIQCVLTPTLADLAANAFDCVVVDEGVRMKGDASLIGLGVRRLNPRYRLVLSATPIKNRLPDLFWLAWWVSGGNPEATTRWPYTGTAEDKQSFAETFCVTERNLTKEDRAEEQGKKKRFEKMTAEVCNIHRLWKLVSPVIVRRRKQDTGEDIVARHRHVVRVPMGTKQSQVTLYHLKARYRDKNGLPAMGAQLQALRLAAAAPHSGLLEAQPNSPDGLVRSPNPFTPKIHAVLSLIEQMLQRGEQAVVFSAFNDLNDALSRYLHLAGVPHLLLDGRTSQKRRGQLSAQFKRGRAGGIPVMLAGVECMAEGHNWFRCRNAILCAYSWAFDKFKQAFDRVHRLNSPDDVHFWSVIAEGTVDRKLEQSIYEKQDSSELVLDGVLMGERAEEVNLGDLLRVAFAEFSQNQKTVDEDDLARQWPNLRVALERAASEWTTVQPSSLVPHPSTPVPQPTLTGWRARRAERLTALLLQSKP